MKKDDLILLFIALLLLTGMLITIIFGGGKSRHGVGLLFDTRPGQHAFSPKKTTLDLGQRQALPAGV